MTLDVRLGNATPFLDVEVELPEGGISVLLGPSGSGKTTVLRAIAGLLKPGRGRVALGADVWFDSAQRIDVSPRRRPVGWVPQSYALFPHLTAQENVECALLDQAHAARASAAKGLLAQLHVGGLEHRYPHQLSGGQQQRVAVARALARAPRVLLLDEPFSAVDRSTRRRLQTELKRLHQAIGTTMVLVTHDLEEARLLASQMVLLHRGHVLQTGAPSDVEQAPVSVAAARLLDIQNIHQGIFEPKENTPGLRWGTHWLACRAPLGSVSVGAPISWCISAGQIVLHRVDRPSRWGSDNPMDCSIEEVLALGDEAQISLRPHSLPDERLVMKISSHLASRNCVVAGGSIRVSLLSSAIQPLPE